MNTVETNIFPILNLDDLHTTYRTYRVQGLLRDHEQFYQLRNDLEKQLSFQLRAPAVIIEYAEQLTLILPIDAGEPAYEQRLGGRQIHLHRQDTALKLHFADRDARTDPIALRFLQFHVQSPLHHDPLLWQPRTGRAYYHRAAELSLGDILGYRGFTVRAMLTGDGGIGLCVDLSTTYMFKNPLPDDLSPDAFRERVKGQNLIYRFGYRWFEIKADHLSDFSVTEFKIGDRTLLSYVTDEASHGHNRLTQGIAALRPQGRVLIYKDNLGNERAAPAALCHRVVTTQHPEVARNHRKTQLQPHERYGHILGAVQRHLQQLTFGDRTLNVSRTPMLSPGRHFSLPALQFGHEKTLPAPVLESNGAQRYGQAKLRLLQDKTAGFYGSGRIRQQLLVLPKTVYRSYGNVLIENLAREVASLSPAAVYNPTVLVYDDQVTPNFQSLGQSLQKAFQARVTTQTIDAALVLLPTASGQPGLADSLAAYTVRELGKQGLHNVAFFHTGIPSQSYQQPEAAGAPYVVHPDSKVRSRFQGYLRNVALNKVLLTNYKWPFVLAEPLRSDLVIGMDIKQQTVGLSMISARGDHFQYMLKNSRQREKLTAPQTAAYFKEVIECVLPHLPCPPRHITVHRDGRLFDTERDGIARAIRTLQEAGTLPDTTEVTLIEIAKTAPSNLRLFARMGSKDIRNPFIGTYHTLDTHSGFICTTGEPLLGGVNGTVRPLYVHRVSGGLTIEHLMQDVLALSSLTWTRPEGCMRDPITIRLLDRFLYEHGGDYDADGLDFAEFADTVVSPTYTLQEVLHE